MHSLQLSPLWRKFSIFSLGLEGQGQQLKSVSKAHKMLCGGKGHHQDLGGRQGCSHAKRRGRLSMPGAQQCRISAMKLPNPSESMTSHMEEVGMPTSVGCVGMATRDTLIFVDEMPSADEALVRVKNVVVCLGGKGVIPALTLRRLGNAAGLLCLTSGAESDLRLNSLLGDSLGRKYLIPALEAANAAWIIIGGNGHTYTAVEERRCRDAWTDQLGTITSRFFDEFSAVYVAAEDPRLLSAALTECAQRPTKVVVNVSSALLGRLVEAPEILEGLIARACCLIMNESENASTIERLGISGWSAFASSWLRCIVVTAGSSGGRYSEAPFSRWTNFEPVRPTRDVTCPVGAGDVFAGAFLLSWLIESEPVSLACQKAAAMASEKLVQQLTGLALDG